MTADLHRFEAHARIKPGEHEHNLDPHPLQLVRVVLSDAGPVITDGGDGHERTRPDVVCPLRPADARALAQHLLELSDIADRLSGRR
jgi:hypothetical protein